MQYHCGKNQLGNSKPIKLIIFKILFSFVIYSQKNDLLDDFNQI
jgi:hypothetical protein